MLRQIALDEPIPPRRLNPAVPLDLETIVLKAMAKDPSGRYATALELSEDLKRFINDDPITGRRPGSFERTLRWARRRWELVATSAAILMLSLCIGGVMILREVGKTQKVSNKFHDYVITHFPLLDRIARDHVTQAGTTLGRMSDKTNQSQVYERYEHVLKMFQEASELPPTDKESRVVIARALCRLASTRTMLCLYKGTGRK